jgi:hypothetical protein
MAMARVYCTQSRVGYEPRRDPIAIGVLYGARTSTVNKHETRRRTRRHQEQAHTALQPVQAHTHRPQYAHAHRQSTDAHHTFTTATPARHQDNSHKGALQTSIEYVNTVHSIISPAKKRIRLAGSDTGMRIGAISGLCVSAVVRRYTWDCTHGLIGTACHLTQAVP